MKFLIVTHVIHTKENDAFYAYGPYVREMNLWLKYTDEVTVIAPLSSGGKNVIDLAYEHQNLKFIPVTTLSFTTFSNALKSLYILPGICLKIASAMRDTEHIHLRCPGNMGLLGCIMQVFFPFKTKTAKYAGNWDFRSKQPITYRLQQVLLRNTFLTKNMTALVYGYWPGNTKNIRSFFTASYNQSESGTLIPRNFDEKIRLIFVGTLSASKQPMMSVKVCESLCKQGYNTELHIYGEGPERTNLQQYIKANNLTKQVILHGNQPAVVIKKAYQDCHFLVFISRSEGWPKAVAEAMWWGCLPLTTNVSCIPQMIGYGQRGELVGSTPEEISVSILRYIERPHIYHEKSKLAMEWARNYTVELFESEIKKMIV